MSRTGDRAPVDIRDAAHTFIRRRLVAEQALWSSQQARAQALLRTVTAMAAFVVAALALLSNADVELSPISLILVTTTFIALGSALIFVSLTLVPKDLARPRADGLAVLIERTERATDAELRELAHDDAAFDAELRELARDIAGFEVDLLEELIAANDRMGQMLRLAFVGEAIATIALIAGFFVLLPAL